MLAINIGFPKVAELLPELFRRSQQDKKNSRNSLLKQIRIALDASTNKEKLKIPDLHETTRALASVPEERFRHGSVDVDLLLAWVAVVKRFTFRLAG